MTPEGKVQAQVVAELKRLGAYYVIPGANQYSRPGVPDILVSFGGRFIGIEVKAGANKYPTAAQVDQLRSIEDSGGKAMVVHDSNVDRLADEIHLAEQQPYWVNIRDRDDRRQAETARLDAGSDIKIRD